MPTTLSMSSRRNTFKSEETLFNQSFEREDDIPYPDDSQVLTVNNLNDAIIGTYHNPKNWPPLKFTEKRATIFLIGGL